MRESRPAKVLIVSGNPNIREALTKTLTDPDLEISSCDSVRSAFFTIIGQPVDLVFADDVLNDGEILDLISRIRLGGNKVPFVILASGDRVYQIEEMRRQQVEVLEFNTLTQSEQIKKLVMRLVSEAPQVSKKRRSPRHACNLDVFFETVRSGEISLSKGVSLSQGGMFLATSFSLPHIGDFVSFRVAASNVSPVEIEGIGVVRWIRQRATMTDPSGFAIEFIGLTADTKDRVTTMVTMLSGGSEMPHEGASR